MKISFEIDNSEAPTLLGALTFAASQTQNSATKDSLDRVIDEIQNDITIDSLLFQLVANLIKHYTNAAIKKDSNLRFELGISTNWLENFLHVGSSKILSYLLQTSKPGKTTDPISQSTAKKCQSVQDIIDIIKSGYEEV